MAFAGVNGLPMNKPLRVLLVEGSEADAALLEQELRTAGYDVTSARVASAEEMRAALERGPWDLIVSDHDLPGCDAPAALELVHARDLDVPFIIVSGAIGEEQAVAAMKAGAHDCLVKGRLARFVPAVKRALSEAQQRRQRKKAEEALRESEDRYRLLVEESPDAIVIYQDGNLVFVNSTGVRQLGARTQAELLGRRVADVIHPDDYPLAMERIRRRLAGETGVYPAEVRYVRLDGTTVAMEVSATPIVIGGRPAVQFIARDITERRQAEEAQVKLEAQLVQAQKLEAIGTLASGVAHEINNPINGVMNYAQLILDQSPSGSRTATFAREIIRETERVATIGRNLLQFARQDNQGQGLVSLVDIVRSSLSLIQTVIRLDQIILAVEVPEDLPPLRCRSQQIQQVLMNLIANARDALNARYAGAHADKIIRLVAERVEREGRLWVRTVVEDHGIGVTEAVRHRLFDPFFTTKPRDQGTGLGLSISRSIVKEHHGELSLVSKPGQWTRFQFELPVCEDGGRT
jgi:PAS domain S-box-containing protein